MSPSTAATVMRIIGWISIIIAIFLAWGGVTDFTGANNLFLSLASSGNQGIDGIATQEAKLALAIAGGLFGGLMGYYTFISAPGVEQGNEMIRKGTIYAFLTWFMIDSSASIGTGNTVNIIPNVIFLILYLFPLVLVKKKPSHARSHP